MSAEQANLWDGLVQMGKELRRTHSAGLLSAALTFAYVCIDTMSYLSLPSEKSQQERLDFMAWVDTYLKADPSQPYQYRGLDVYAARCAVLHAFSSEAELHRKDPGVRLFGYHDGGRSHESPAPRAHWDRVVCQRHRGCHRSVSRGVPGRRGSQGACGATSSEGSANLPDPGPMIAAISAPRPPRPRSWRYRCYLPSPASRRCPMSDAARHGRHDLRPELRPVWAAAVKVADEHFEIRTQDKAAGTLVTRHFHIWIGARTYS